MGDDVRMDLTFPDPSLVLLVGPSGAGKSTFARAHFKPTQVISSDDLRAWVSDDPADQNASADAFRILALLVNGRLKRRLTAVVDATNLRSGNRRRLRSIATRYGVPAIAVLFDLPAAAYFANNSARADRHVDDEVVDRQLELMRQAVADVPGEGYAAFFVVGP
jgi:protein phosphatase